MKEKNFSQPRVSPQRKIALALLGLVLSLVLLEAGLRLGGFVLQSILEHGNLQSIKQKGTYRILCIGESMTLGQYPSFLEQILNRRNVGVRFGVIDKGKGGADTSAILSQVESYLAEYRPDMVVAMMGINDRGVRYYQDIPESESWLFRHCRIYRFGRILFMYILKKIKREDIYRFSRSDPGKEAVLTKAMEMGFHKPDEDKQDLGKAQTPLPGTGSKETSAESASTEESFKKAIEPNPKNDNAYVELGRLYKVQGKFPQAEDFFRKAIELNPKNEKAYVELGKLCGMQGKLSQAEDFFRKAIELNPKNENAYCDLGQFYRNHHKLPQAEDAFEKAIEVNPKNFNSYFCLGEICRLQGKFSQAEYSFKKAIEIGPNDRMFGAITSLYEEMGKPELAKEYTKKANQSGSGDFASVTVNNYRKLKEILDKKGIKLVCVQYPIRSIAPLKRTFEKDKGIIFVDNESLFKEVLRKASCEEYFRDMFAGDFGHCTQKGNELLAQNIADVILREVFNK